MSAVDFPDWQRTEQWVGTPFYNNVAVIVPNDSVFGPFPVAQWESIAFSIFVDVPTPDRFTIDINFYDVIGGPLTARFRYNVLQGIFPHVFADTIPVQAAYMTFKISNMAGQRTMRFTVIPRRGNNPMNRLWIGDPLLEIASVAIGPGVTVQADLSPIMTARGTWTVYTDANVWLALLQHFDIGGTTLAYIAVMGSTVSRSAQSVQVDLPPGTVGFQFSNSDAVARTYSASFVPLRT